MAKFPIASMTQYMVRNPFATAAALFAPLFAKNEDRGYFRTALITTPIVFATGALVPHMFAGMRAISKQGVLTADALLRKSEGWMRFEAAVTSNPSSVFNSQIMNNTADQALSASLVASRRSRDFFKEQKTLEKLFNRMFTKPEDLISKAAKGNTQAARRIQEIDTLLATKGRLISNALHVSRRSSFTPTEWGTELLDLAEMGIPADEWGDAIGGGLPLMNIDQMKAMFNRYAARPEFRTSLKQRLREIGRLNVSGKGTISPHITGMKTFDTVLDAEDYSTGLLAEGEGDITNVSPSILKNLREAKARKNIVRAVITSEDVVKGKTGRALSVRVTRMVGNIKEELDFPIVDPATGQVRLGTTGVGVGANIIDETQQAYPVDEWTAKVLAENKGVAWHGENSLESDIARGAYWAAPDALDASEMAGLSATHGGVPGKQAIWLRHYSANVTTLNRFKDSDGEAIPFNRISAKQEAKWRWDLKNTNRYIDMGSDRGVFEGRYQLREAAFLDPLAAPNPQGQDWLWRTLSKPGHLTAPEGMPANSKLLWTSSFMKNMEATSGESIPLATGIFHNLSPQDRALFAELPETLTDLHFQRSNVIQQFLERGMNGEAATAMYNDVYKLYEEGNQGALAKLGRIGETTALWDESYSKQFRFSETSKYNVSTPGLDVGATVGPNDVLGYDINGMRVLPKHSGTITNIAQGDKDLVYNITHELGMEGAKADIAGRKGIGTVASSEDFGIIKGLMNSFYQRTGSTGFVSEDVNAFVPAEYVAAKIDPKQAYLNMGADLVNRLQRATGEDIATDYLSQMESHFGASFEMGQFVIDSSKLSANDAAAAENIRSLARITENFFATAAEAITKASGYSDPVFTSYVQAYNMASKKFGLGEWMLKNRIALPFGVWNHVDVNVPRAMNVGYDFETYMEMSGNLAGKNAVLGRLKTVSGGDPAQSIEFMKSLYSKSYLEEGFTVPAAEAFHGKNSLVGAAARANSIFDPSIEAYKQNFRIDLGGGKYIPVPGTAAYGAEAPVFAPGEYQTRYWQKIVKDIAQDPSKFEELEPKLMAAYGSEFGIGKGSAVRPYRFDPLARSGVLAASAEHGDPFTARVSEDWVRSLHSVRMRKDLMQGNVVLGIMHRQPTNELMYMKYQLDKSISGANIAVPQSFSTALFGDHDQDTINNYLFDVSVRMENNKMVALNRVGTEAPELAAAREGISAIENKQRMFLDVWHKHFGTEDIPNMYAKDWKVPSLFARTGFSKTGDSLADKVANRAGIAMNRTAGGVVGPFSNALTDINIQIAQNMSGMDPKVSAGFRTALFDIRQVPISSGKTATMNRETAMQMLQQLTYGIEANNPKTAAEKVGAAMQRISKTIHGADSSQFAYWQSEEAAGALAAWSQARTEKAALAAAALKVGSNKFGREIASKNVLPELFKHGYENVMGIYSGKSAANISAGKIGTVSEYVAAAAKAAESATGKMGKVFAKHGKALAIGAGVLAALGVAMTPATLPVATFSRSSGNRYRPENEGVADNIPGEPVAGEMSPTAPPRRTVAAQPGVRTTVVAPMRQTSDLSIRMRATDQARAAETIRLMSQIPGSGDTNVTINYRDKTKLNSLRTREKIREIRH